MSQLACRMLAVACVLALGEVQASDSRLESIKQHALALYTISLSDKRLFRHNAMVLADVARDAPAIHDLQISVDGRPVVSYRYSAAERALLAAGSVHQLGIVPWSAGVHTVVVEGAYLQPQARAAPRLRERVTSQQLELNDWPQAIRVSLVRDPESGEPQWRLSPHADGAALLAASEFELLSGHPGKSLIILRNLSHTDPARARGARYSNLLGRSLSAWGMGEAAEQVFADLAKSELPARERAAAQLQAAELALERQVYAQAAAYLAGPRKGWTEPQRRAADVLGGRTLLGQGKLDGALQVLPPDAAPVWRYNLAAALIAQDRAAEGYAVLEQLGRIRPADADDVDMRDRANLVLGYEFLRNGNAAQAKAALARVDHGSALADQALLAQGWAALTLPGASAASPDDGLRPLFVRRIEAALGTAPSTTRDPALRKALKFWLPLLQRDPLQPVVQEAMAAVPYALAVGGDYGRARVYAERAVARLESLRIGLLAARARARQGSRIDAAQLAQAAWPPRSGGWADLMHVDAWWLDGNRTAPANAHWARLMVEPTALRILQGMTVLSDAEALAVAAASDPDLRLRSSQLQARIAGERQARQGELDRFVWAWLQAEIARSGRYLVMSRMVLARVYDRLRNEGEPQP